MFWLKILIGVILWAICHFACKKMEDIFPDEYTEYDRFSSYMCAWLVTFFIIILIISSF